MARDYGKIFGRSYNDATLRGLPEDARNLFRYLCTSSHSNAAGVYRASLDYVALDLQWGIDRVKEGFANLYAKPFATYDQTHCLVFIPGWWNDNPIENRNVAKHVVGIIKKLPDCATKRHAINALLKFGCTLPDAIKSKDGPKPNEAKQMLRDEFGDPLETLSEALPNPFKDVCKLYATQEPEHEPEPVVRRLGKNSVSQLELSRATPVEIKPRVEPFDPERDRPAHLDARNRRPAVSA